MRSASIVVALAALVLGAAARPAEQSQTVRRAPTLPAPARSRGSSREPALRRGRRHFCACAVPARFFVQGEAALLAVAETPAPAGPARSPGDVNIKSNLNGPCTPAAPAAPPAAQAIPRRQWCAVNGTVACKTLHAKEATIKGDASVGTVTASRVSATLLSSDVVETGILRSPSGTITIDANLALSSSASQRAGVTCARSLTPAPPPSASAAAMSFLATDVIVDGVRQWRMLSHEDFSNGADGWAPATATSACGSKDQLLGGHCNLGRGEVSKRFEGLPAHTQIKLVARVHFLDSWNGEAVRCVSRVAVRLVPASADVPLRRRRSPSWTTASSGPTRATPRPRA